MSGVNIPDPARNARIFGDAPGCIGRLKATAGAAARCQVWRFGWVRLVSASECPGEFFEEAVGLGIERESELFSADFDDQMRVRVRGVDADGRGSLERGRRSRIWAAGEGVPGGVPVRLRRSVGHQVHRRPSIASRRGVRTWGLHACAMCRVRRWSPSVSPERLWPGRTGPRGPVSLPAWTVLGWPQGARKSARYFERRALLMWRAFGGGVLCPALLFAEGDEASDHAGPVPWP